MASQHLQRRPKRKLLAGIVACALATPMVGFGLVAPAFADDTPPEPVITEEVILPDTTEEVVEKVDPLVTQEAPVGAEETTDSARFTTQTETPMKVYVCKYVGTPGVDETLQTGQNPISVSVNAIPDYQGVGSYFADQHGRSYVLIEDTGQPEPDVTLCPDPVIPDPTCVDDPTWSYTFDPATGSGVITVTGGEEGDELCEPLAVRAAAWTYDPPAFGSPSWPQTLHGFNDTAVDKIGAFNYGPPQLENCHQYDVYASFGGFDELVLPTQLIGSHNPSEPAFLHETLYGFGPNPTYSYTSSAGCNPPQECIADFDPATGYVNPDEVGKEPTQVEAGLEFGKGDLIHFPAGLVSAVGLHDLAYTVVSSTGPSPAYKMEVFANGTTGYATWNWEPSNNGFAVNATGTFSNLEDGKWWSSKIPSGPGSIAQPILYEDLVAIYDGATKIISFGTGIGSTTESTAVVSNQTFLCGTGDFTKPPTEVEPESPTMVDVCGVENDSFTLPGAEPNELESVKAEGTYTADELPIEDGTVAVTFVPADGYVVKDDPEAEYEVDESGNAVWLLVFTDEACPIVVVPEGPAKVDVCGVDKDTFTLPGAKSGETESVTDEGTYTAEGDPTKGEDVVVTFTPNSEHTVDSSADADYEVVDGKAVWTLTYTNVSCPPPPVTPPGLALTGSNATPVLGLAAVLLALGITLAVTGTIKRRKATDVV